MRIGSPLSWVVAWVLAIAAPVVVLAWPGTVTRVVGLALLAPLVGLAMWRAEKKGFDDGASGLGDGPWAPPP